MRFRCLAAVCLPVVVACAGAGPAATVEPPPPAAPLEATSLLGAPLVRPPLPEEFRRQQEELLAAARAELEAAPGSVDALIWVARRTAYLGRFREAVELYGSVLAAHPDEPRLLRHRGHRHLTLRRLDLAVADLELAARLVEGESDRVEPDGLPNPAGIPTSTLHSNIWYHLGLAYYLRGELERTADAYQRCQQASRSTDMFIACTYWRYLALRRLGREAEAVKVLGPVRHELELLENHDYQRLLLLFKGDLSPDEELAAARERGGVGFATVAYGVGVWHLLAGQADEARRIFEEIVAAPDWPAFGHLAAEAELARSAAPRSQARLR